MQITKTELEDLTESIKRQAHHERCEEEGHDMQNAMDATFKVYMMCKWCKEVQK